VTNLLCRKGWHKWMPWVKSPYDKNILRRTCRRCGVQQRDQACDVGLHKFGAWDDMGEREYTFYQERYCDLCNLRECRRVKVRKEPPQ